MIKKNKSGILKELESDDELPDVYIDANIVPAYLNDNRFDDIKFSWIDDDDLSALTKPKSTFNKEKHEEKYSKSFVMKGMLKRQDLYCLKSIEKLTNSSTLIWFANFLLYKDLQSHYKYLRSCLVTDILSPVQSTKTPRQDNKEMDDLQNSLEIVIKF